MRPAWQVNLLAAGAAVAVVGVGIGGIALFGENPEPKAHSEPAQPSVSAPANPSSSSSALPSSKPTSAPTTPSSRPRPSVSESPVLPEPSSSRAEGPRSLYVLGDSLTVGMRDKADLPSTLTDAGWQVTKLNALGGRTIDQGLAEIDKDAATVKDSTTALVALGTNDFNRDAASVQRSMQATVDKLKGINPDVEIKWVDFYIASGDGERPDSRKLNQALDTVAAANGIDVVQWGDSEEAGTSLGPDGVHMTDEGYGAMAAFVTKSIDAG